MRISLLWVAVIGLLVWWFFFRRSAAA